MITNLIVVALNAWNLRREFSPQRDLGAVLIEPSAPFLATFCAPTSTTFGTASPISPSTTAAPASC